MRSTLLIVQSIMKTFIAVAALVAVMAITPANAKAVDQIEPATAAAKGVSSVQLALITRQEARDARREMRRGLREPCRTSSNSWRERRSCFRDARHEWRDHRRAARRAYRDCRREGSPRSECRQAQRAYWVDQNGGGTGDSSGGGDSGGGPRGDD